MNTICQNTSIKLPDFNPDLLDMVKSYVSSMKQEYISYWKNTLQHSQNLEFYHKVKTLIPNITQLPINGLINELMNSSNYFINIQFIKYISACFDVRDKLLSK